MPTDNNLPERIAEIKQRRSKMDQFGPLSVGLTPGSHRSFVIVKGDIGLEANCGVVGERNSAKAEFFANAPADIDALIAHVEQLEREVAELKQGLRVTEAIAHGLGDVINGRTTPIEEVRKRLGIKKR
jgi:hypothetical protein